MEQKFIEVRGAREHNLKGVDMDIPRDQLVVITGLSLVPVIVIVKINGIDTAAPCAGAGAAGDAAAGAGGTASLIRPSPIGGTAPAPQHGPD